MRCRGAFLMHAIAVMRHNFAFCTRSNTLKLVETGLLSKILSNQIGEKFNNGRVSLQIFFFSPNNVETNVS